jgi:hypothetical protein
VGLKLFLDNFFSSSELYDDLLITAGQAIAKAVSHRLPTMAAWV